MSLRPALLLLLAALAGCNPFQTRESPSVAYSPALTVALPEQLAPVDWQLVVARPSAENMLSSTRIAVRQGDAQLQVLAGARWSDPTPELLQGLVVRAFEDSGRILGVGRQASGLRGDYTLTLDIRAFEAVYPATGAPEARVVFTAKLLGGAGHRVLAAQRFEASAGARGRQAPAVVAAFEEALESSVAELVAWALRHGEAAKAP